MLLVEFGMTFAGSFVLGPTPRTMALVGVFFPAFMLYYFTNWKLLGFLWRIG